MPVLCMLTLLLVQLAYTQRTPSVLGIPLEQSDKAL